MYSDSVPPRRKGPKQPPRLPLSAFTPPNSGTSDRFPLPPSPSTIHPQNVVDAHVVGDRKLEKWQRECGQALDNRARGVVISVPAAEAQETLNELEGRADRDKVISLMISFSFDDAASISAATDIAATSSLPISFATTISSFTPQSVEALRGVLQKGRPVDIEYYPSDMTETSLGGLGDFLDKVTEGLEQVPPIILSNLLPPPHHLELPIVKLLTHPLYQRFQNEIAGLSLHSDTYVKYLPPAWGAATPPTPLSDSPAEDSGAKDQREWKRRIKMYLGPVLEAFGYERIIFGSSPPAASRAPSNSWDWYNVARESLAELGVEQEFVDSVFSLNAQKVYGKK